jgi:hypothetical protein
MQSMGARAVERSTGTTDGVCGATLVPPLVRASCQTQASCLKAGWKGVWSSRLLVEDYHTPGVVRDDHTSGQNPVLRE